MFPCKCIYSGLRGPFLVIMYNIVGFYLGLVSRRNHKRNKSLFVLISIQLILFHNTGTSSDMLISSNLHIFNFYFRFMHNLSSFPRFTFLLALRIKQFFSIIAMLFDDDPFPNNQYPDNMPIIPPIASIMSQLRNIYLSLVKKYIFLLKLLL